jgi:hypothetical protein
VTDPLGEAEEAGEATGVVAGVAGCAGRENVSIADMQAANIEFLTGVALSVRFISVCFKRCPKRDLRDDPIS